MVEHGIWICFTESCDSFVLRKHGDEHCIQTLAAPLTSGSKGQHLTVLIIVKHWHFGLAAPAPEHEVFERGRECSSGRAGKPSFSDACCLRDGACASRLATLVRDGLSSAVHHHGDFGVGLRHAEVSEEKQCVKVRCLGANATE